MLRPASVYFGIASIRNRGDLAIRLLNVWTRFDTSSAGTEHASECVGRVRSPQMLLLPQCRESGPKRCYIFCAHWTRLLSSVTISWRLPFVALLLFPQLADYYARVKPNRERQLWAG